MGLVRLFFAHDSAELPADAGAPLAQVAQIIVAQERPVVIVGHTDSTGSLEHNADLGHARAYAVANELHALGVPTGLLEWHGVGPSQPLASNATAEGRARNRRVEVYWVAGS